MGKKNRVSSDTKGRKAEQGSALPPIQRDKHRHATFMYNSAVSLHQQGNILQAASLYHQAIVLHPTFIEAYLNLIAALGVMGKLQEAMHVCNQAIRIAPTNASAYNNRGNVWRDMRCPDMALTDYDRAIHLNPGLADAHHNRGMVLLDMKRYDEALAACNQSVFLFPSSSNAHLNRGVVLSTLGRREDALSSFDLAIATNPHNAKAHANRGAVLTDLRRFDEALSSCDRSIELAPSAIAFQNRGNIMEKLGRYEDALADYDQAIRINPNLADAYSNKANVLNVTRQFNDALSLYDQAIALNPEHAEAHWNKGLLMLLNGNYTAGWKEYEWRWKSRDFKSSYRKFTQPMWMGNKEDLRGKTILIHTDQGQGDVIQMLRYIPMIAEWGASIVLDVPRSLVPVVREIPDVVVLEHGSVLPPFDLHCSFMSLPLAFGTTLESIPVNIPYVRVTESMCETWKSLLGSRNRIRIGLAWTGNASHHNDHNRSIALHRILPLLDHDAEFYSLQVDYRDADRAMIVSNGKIADLSLIIEHYGHTAALIANLDLVITVDTSVAHLAGAMGRPVWILLPYAPDYRWLLDREDSPWYPTARLFRQPSFGDWESVIEQVCAALNYI